MDRAPGLSVRLKLTLSYAGFLMLAGVLLLAAVWVFLLRYVPDRAALPHPSRGGSPQPVQPPARLRLDRGHRAGVPAGVRSRWEGGFSPAECSPFDPHHRRHTHGRERIALLPDPAGGPQDEFRELADAFDTMLARLEAHVAEQQRFAANASHELRTPLAITQTLLDVARNDPNRDNDELVDRLHAVNTRAIDLTEALLLLSRADQRSFTREHVDLSLIAEEATETLLPSQKNAASPSRPPAT